MQNKQDNFKRISENRKDKILALLSQMTNLTNTSFYEYSDEEILKLFEEIEDATKRSKELLLKANEKKNKRFVI